MLSKLIKVNGVDGDRLLNRERNAQDALFTFQDIISYLVCGLSAN